MSIVASLSRAPRSGPQADRIAAQTISSAGTYDLIATLATDGVDQLTITGTVGGTEPMTGLQITFAAIAGGQHVVAYQGNFDQLQYSPHDTVRRVLSPNQPTGTGGRLGNITTGQSFQITLRLGAVAEVNIRASSSAGAALALETFAF